MKTNYNDFLYWNIMNYKWYNDKIDPFIGIIIQYFIGTYFKATDEEKIEKIAYILKNNPTELMKFIKILLPYGLIDNLAIRYQYNNKNQLNQDKLDFHNVPAITPIIPKFKFIDDKLYIYDYMLSQENQKMIEVIKINDINVEQIISKFKSQGFTTEQIEKLIMHKELLMCLGFDSSRYDLSIIDNNNVMLIEMDDPNLVFDFSIFRKEHTKSHVLNKEQFNLTQISEDTIENKSIAYSFDSNLKLLSLLHGLSKSQRDIQLFSSIYLKEREIIHYEENSDMYLDWMFISSYFLLNREEKTVLPDYVYLDLERKMKSNLNYTINEETLESTLNPLCIFLNDKNEEISYSANVNETNYGSNEYIYENGTINYRKLFHCIRNGLAHSSYEIIDKNYIRIYGFDENKNLNINIKVKKEIILEFVDKLYAYNTFENIFPICTLDNPNYNNESVSDLEEIKKYLKNITISDITINKYHDLDMMKKIQYLASLGIKDDNLNNKDYSKILEILEYDYNKKIWHLKFKLQNPIIQTAKHVEQIAQKQLKYHIDFEYAAYKLTEQQMENILKNIELYSDTFFNHSATNQHLIISELVKDELNPNRNISNIIHEIIKGDSKSQGDIIDYLSSTATKYIDYNKVIKATIIAYLNNILLYNYNINTSINHDNLNFSCMVINKDSLIKRKNTRIKNLKQENGNYLCTIKNKEKHIKNLTIRMEHVSDKDKDKIKAEIDKAKAELEVLKREYPVEIIEKNKQEITEITEEILLIDNNDFNLNSYIFEHLRNSLAHGNMSFSNNIDINNIGDIELLFTDYYPSSGRESFCGKIKFADLLTILSEEQFVSSLFLTSKDNEKKSK